MLRARDARAGEAERVQTPPPSRPSPVAPDACGVLANDIALARLAALEAYERAVPRLLEALARDVLARELAIAPPDLAALARALAREFADAGPVAFVACREDARQLPVDLPVRVDPALRAGDLVLEVRDGEVDARFALRFRGAIDGCA